LQTEDNHKTVYTASSFGKVEPVTVPQALPRYLQLLWDKEPTRRRGPKPGRSIQDIGNAAVEIADRDSLEAVSMKAVAQSIGLTTMSLYRYLDSKEELYAVMLDCAYGPPDPALVAGGGWRLRLERWARALADALLAHPWITVVPITAPPLTPHVLSWTNLGVRAFAGTPLTHQEKLSSLLVVDGYVRSHVHMSMTLGLVGPLVDAMPPETVGYGATLGQLIDPVRYPSLTAAAPALEDDDEDFFEGELAFGLRLVLDGVAALIGRNR